MEYFSSDRCWNILSSCNTIGCPRVVVRTSSRFAEPSVTSVQGLMISVWRVQGIEGRSIRSDDGPGELSAEQF